MLKLDNLPVPLTLSLFTGSDFSAVIVGEWPEGTVLTMEFELADPWSASITGEEAVFTVPHTVADLVKDNEEVAIWYANGTARQCWARGHVQRHA